MKKIVFVCTGNTCRSPMAEGLFRAYLQKRDMGFIEVSGAGLAAAAGSPPTDFAVTAAKEFGADIAAHRSRTITRYDLQEPETCFVCMTREHAAVLQMYVEAERILTLDIADPYGGDLAVYTRCAHEIEKKLPSVLRFAFGVDDLHRLCADDLAAVADIEQQCFAHPWSVSSIEEEFTNPTARFFVCVADGKAVGYIGANNIADEVYMANLAVLPSYRGRGIGELLLRVLLCRSEAEKAHFVTLEVRPSNTPARKLYEKCGFQKRGVRKRFYRDPEEDALIYTCPISEQETP